MQHIVKNCIFCQIAAGEVPASIVFEDEQTLTFLDHRPVFPGHCLLIPRQHFDSLVDVPPTLLSQLSANARLLAIAVEQGLGAQGAFVAINNRVSQSVPHVHVHVVPRTKGDGLKGFFWPRHKYRDMEHLEEVRGSLARALKNRT
ncbi:MAG TPA: HIT family protein [Terriglobales bacterium]|nr:HIT family protein [Terriglobales bacterium]